MIVSVIAISNLVLTQQIYSEETNGAHAHYREPVPLSLTWPLGCMTSVERKKRWIFLSILLFSKGHLPDAFFDYS